MRREQLAELRKHIRAIERPIAPAGKAALSLGLPALDNALPQGGLALGALHEVTAGFGDPAANGFALALLGKLCAGSGHVLWCRLQACTATLGLPYGPGLARFGVAPEQFTFVEVAKPADVLWAMEEGLKAGGLAAVYGEGISLDLTSSRRLQLAAEAHGVTAIVQLPAGQQAPPSAALTRWRVSSMQSSPLQLLRSRWNILLERCRGGSTGQWILDWDDSALSFRLVAEACDGSLPQSRAV